MAPHQDEYWDNNHHVVHHPPPSSFDNSESKATLIDDMIDDMIDDIDAANNNREDHLFVNMGIRPVVAPSSISIKQEEEQAFYSKQHPKSILRIRNTSDNKAGNSMTFMQSFSSSYFQQSLSNNKKSVHFPDSYSVVTSIFTRPYTSLVDIPTLYYSVDDLKRFKQEFRMERITSRRRAMMMKSTSSGSLTKMEKEFTSSHQSPSVVPHDESSSSPSSYVSPQPHDNSFWRSKISRRWYGGRNTAPSSSVRTVSPERRPDEHESASSSCIDPLNDGSTLYDASPLYEDHDIIDYDSDESMSDCASDNSTSSLSSSPPSSPVSVFSSVFDHFHGSGLATATSVSSSPCGENKGVLSHANRQCFVDTLYLF